MILLWIFHCWSHSPGVGVRCDRSLFHRGSHSRHVGGAWVVWSK